VRPILAPSKFRVLPEHEGGGLLLRSKEDAELIAEADNVRFETNLTPRQLLEQRDELRTLVAEAVLIIKDVIANGFDVDGVDEPWLKQAKAILANCGKVGG
jgi:hypothetical protein